MSEKGFALPGKTANARRARFERGEEKALIAAARTGDARAMRRILESVSGPVLRFASGFCRQREDAEDVVQESLAAVARSLKEFRGDASLTTWAFTVARNACLRRRRRERARDGITDSLDAPESGATARAVADRGRRPDEEAERGELLASLEAAIAALPVTQREVLLLRDVEGLSTLEVGRVLGLEEAAVKSRLHRARLSMRAALAPIVTPDAPAPRRGCPRTARMLSRYMEREIDARTCARLASHVADCESCSAACDSLRAVVGECGRLGNRPAPPELRGAIREAIRRVVAEAGAPASGGARRPAAPKR
jgi:RNA polymerase sigma-70 factor (ECF subfamily)